jgi:hypothetical protein
MNGRQAADKDEEGAHSHAPTNKKRNKVATKMSCFVVCVCAANTVCVCLCAVDSQSCCLTHHTVWFACCRRRRFMLNFHLSSVSIRDEDRKGMDMTGVVDYGAKLDLYEWTQTRTEVTCTSNVTFPPSHVNCVS